jgi:hypothetical protein
MLQNKVLKRIIGSARAEMEDLRTSKCAGLLLILSFRAIKYIRRMGKARMYIAVCLQNPALGVEGR